MSVDDRFRGVDWDDLLYRLTLRARQLFAGAWAKGYGNALARTCVDPGDLAQTVLAAAIQYETVKYKPSKGATLLTFLYRVLEDDFKDLLRKGVRLNRRLTTLDTTAEQDPELPAHQEIISDVNDDGRDGKLIHLRAAALHAAKGSAELNDYVTAAFDCGATTRADQAEMLKVAPSEITNLRKKFLRLMTPGAQEARKESVGEK
jgi:DNA-directed RNA polymerase specialized sigma24 family protein